MFLDVAFSFSENLDGWQKVWGHASLLFEEDTIFLLDGQLAIEDTEHLAFPTRTLDQTWAVERQPVAGLVQGLPGRATQYLLRLFGL